MKILSEPNLEQHIQDIELENSNLASLYVALSQLHSTLDVNEVLGVIVEILLNFVGAEEFAVMIIDKEDALRPITTHGVAREDVPALQKAGMYAASIASGDPKFGAFQRGPAPGGVSGEPSLCIPLHAAGEVIGVMPVWSFLRQKEALTDIDHEIIQLMSKSAGTALEAARLAMTARPEPGTKSYYEAFAELIA